MVDRSSLEAAQVRGQLLGVNLNATSYNVLSFLFLFYCQSIQHALFTGEAAQVGCCSAVLWPDGGTKQSVQRFDLLLTTASSCSCMFAHAFPVSRYSRLTPLPLPAVAGAPTPLGGGPRPQLHGGAAAREDLPDTVPRAPRRAAHLPGGAVALLERDAVPLPEYRQPRVLRAAGSAGKLANRIILALTWCVLVLLGVQVIFRIVK